MGGCSSNRAWKRLAVMVPPPTRATTGSALPPAASGPAEPLQALSDSRQARAAMGRRKLMGGVLLKAGESAWTYAPGAADTLRDFRSKGRGDSQMAAPSMGIENVPSDHGPCVWQG